MEKHNLFFAKKKHVCEVIYGVFCRVSLVSTIFGSLSTPPHRRSQSEIRPHQCITLGRHGEEPMAQGLLRLEGLTNVFASNPYRTRGETKVKSSLYSK